MTKENRRFYFTTLAILLVLSAYPIIMGMKIVAIYLIDGAIETEDYARYVIPYTAICFGIIISTLLYPIVSKLKKRSNIAAIALGLCSFVGIELYMENITINAPAVKSAVDWQLFSCVGTPAAVQAFQKPYSDAYKIHYFLVSFVMIALIINIVYGYGKFMEERKRAHKIQLWMQIIPTVLLLGLCIFANLTGFFRDKGEYLSPLSSFLTGMFFIVLGVAAGTYVGSYLLDKKKGLSILAASTAAIVVCSIMYYGESKLLDGTLYRFGKGFIFSGLPIIAVSPADIAIILMSGIITGIIMLFSREKTAALEFNHGRHGKAEETEGGI